MDSTFVSSKELRLDERDAYFDQLQAKAKEKILARMDKQMQRRLPAKSSVVRKTKAQRKAIKANRKQKHK